jgi:hypothetical protein
MIIIEAFARKTPVIVRDLGALPEVVNDSNGGFVYRTDEELLAAVGRIATSATLRSELGENGYQAFLRWWSREAHIELYFDFLHRVAIKKFGYVPWDGQQEAKPGCQATRSPGEKITAGAGLLTVAGEKPTGTP